jgi:hypothetical protein
VECPFIAEHCVCLHNGQFIKTMIMSGDEWTQLEKGVLDVI